MAIAASLVIGLAIGFTVAKFPIGDGSAAPLVADEAMTRVLLHVGTNDRDAMDEALASARYILEDFSRTGRAVRVHIVANGPGLDIFRRSVSPFADTIKELETEYSNVQFVACQNTIEKVEKRLRKPVVLLPEVLRVDSGIADIARKRARGWLYIGV
jgi:hypothetical protein